MWVKLIFSHSAKAFTNRWSCCGSKVQRSVPACVARNSWWSKRAKPAFLLERFGCDSMIASRRLLYVVERCVWSPCWECARLVCHTMWINCCHSCGEYCDASVSSPALVSGNLIHCKVSVSQRCRIMAWSGGMAELGGVARYHVGGMYPRSPERARSSHSAMVMAGGFWFKAFCLSVACWSGGTYRPGCSICPTSVQQL